MNDSIVIDLGYGDSGKGLTVDWLASSFEYGAVVRYSGGSQCGHGVRHPLSGGKEGIFHEFQTWGSGTLRGLNTYLTKDVVFDPILIVKEFKKLFNITEGRMGRMIINSHAPVITPYDVYANQNSNTILQHGTCGRGIFTTKKRELSHYHIHAIDLLYPSILDLKLKELSKFYDMEVDLTDFLESIDVIRKNDLKFTILNDDRQVFYDNVIFESSQGLMLDENIGIFPHCTPSTLDIPEGRDIKNIYLVTRAYHSRHGAGPLTTEQYPVKRSEWETNYDNAYQGIFRTGILDLDVLSYSLYSSNVCEYTSKRKDIKVNLVITHLDVVRDDWRLYKNGEVIKCADESTFVNYILNTFTSLTSGMLITFDNVYTNDSPFAGNIKHFG